jgi:alkylation response protein AidB-like acyl-CoA dehydrogenase
MGMPHEVPAPIPRGGIGFTWKYDLHLFLRRAKANAHAFGDARWHREHVAAAML